jgi:hypothetical protein
MLTCCEVQAVWVEYLSISTGLRFEEAAAWAAFQGLHTQGMLVTTRSRSQAKLPMKRWRVVLSVSPDDIKQGLERSETNTSALHDSLFGVGGVQRVEASVF